MVLWSYLIWYLVVLVQYFDASPSLWANALGISAVMGTAYYLTIAHSDGRLKRLDRWQTFRLYLMPFAVSSFAALIRDQGFFIVFHPTVRDNLLAFALIAAFCAIVLLVRRFGGAAELSAAASCGEGAQAGTTRIGA